jgi:hypothetical protein
MPLDGEPYAEHACVTVIVLLPLDTALTAPETDAMEIGCPTTAPTVLPDATVSTHVDPLVDAPVKATVLSDVVILLVNVPS